MTDFDVLQWAQSVTGVGGICEKRVNVAIHRPAWTWAVWSNEASKLLTELLPYLRIKRSQAENLIEFQAGMRRPGSKGLTDAEWLFRETCRAKSQKLNQRGVAA
jgi:hypothetical protein